MRMTNKIMQNNSLYNINNNKVLQDKLSTQMSTQKKVTRPSDDPVVAIRALRLRNDVSQISQYYEKNAPDAESWLKVTGDALNTTSEIITSLLKEINKGSNKDLGYEDLDIILTQMKALKDEFYSTGNVDYAGRYVFSGYRTDTTLSYTEDTKQDFSITEKLGFDSIDKINYTNIDDLKNLSDASYDPTAGLIDKSTISSEDIYRLRLSYDNLTGSPAKPVVKYVSDATTVPPTETELINPNDIETVSLTNDPSPYEQMMGPANAGKAIFIPETGELLIGKGMYADVKAKAEGKEIRVTYEKDDWKKGDMRPQHYFACQDKTNVVNYNYEKDGAGNSYIPCGNESQIMEYEVGYNQKVRVNTTAGEVFTLDVDRNIDDLERALSEMKEIDKTVKNLKGMLEGLSEGEPGYDNLQKTYEAATEAYDRVRENVQKLYEGLTTKVQGTLNATSVAITDNGTRSSRLDLVSNRLMTQKTTFKTLQSENEDVDMTEVTIQLTSMGYTFQSALLATGKIMQNSLMNYI